MNQDPPRKHEITKKNINLDRDGRPQIGLDVAKKPDSVYKKIGPGLLQEE